MGWESSDVFRFDLGPLLQGQTRIAKLKSVYNFGFTLQTMGTNNKQVISAFKFGLEGGVKGQMRPHQKIPSP